MLPQDTKHLIQNTMLPRRKYVPRSSRQLDHTKTSWPSSRDTKCSGMDMSPVHQFWPKPSCKAQWRGEEDKADRRRGVKTTSGNGQARSFPLTYLRLTHFSYRILYLWTKYAILITEISSFPDDFVKRCILKKTQIVPIDAAHFPLSETTKIPKSPKIDLRKLSMTVTTCGLCVWVTNNR